MNLQTVLVTSFAEARRVPVEANSPQALHRARSRSWVEALAAQLRTFYSTDDSIRVFSKHHAGHRAEFGLNELLYDVLVCRVDTVLSSGQRKMLWYVKETLWQIESEFRSDSRHALYDFNKLVLGSAPVKLFVGPQSTKNLAFIDTLLPAARACSGQVYLTLIPHPQDWEQPDCRIDIWTCANGQWKAMNSE